MTSARYIVGSTCQTQDDLSVDKKLALMRSNEPKSSMGQCKLNGAQGSRTSCAHTVNPNEFFVLGLASSFLHSFSLCQFFNSFVSLRLLHRSVEINAAVWVPFGVKLHFSSFFLSFFRWKERKNKLMMTYYTWTA